MDGLEKQRERSWDISLATMALEQKVSLSKR
jgi:hypothetical protein